MIQITAIGNLTRNAEVKPNKEGTFKFINFSLASNNGKGKATYLECVQIKNADQSTKVSEYLIKGQKVFVQGIMEVTENDGKKYTKCLVSKIELCGKSNSAENTTENANTEKKNEKTDDLPF